MDNLKCLSQECIHLLNKNQLIKPLIKAELIKEEYINKKTIDFDMSECRTPTFFTQYNLASKDKVI